MGPPPGEGPTRVCAPEPGLNNSVSALSATHGFETSEVRSQLHSRLALMATRAIRTEYCTVNLTLNLH